MFTVLYVDDEPDLLVTGRIFLEKSAEFRVITQTSAEEALQSTEIQDCDAIVSDFQMPEMDGIAFLKAVRRKHGDLPFILFTGRGREEIVIQAINNGADFYLQKGGDVKAQYAELAHKIRQAIARRQAESRLVESEKRLADIINFLPDATFAIDRDGQVIAWNRAIVEMTGVPADAMLGKGNHDYSIPIHGERRLSLIDMIAEPDEVLAQHYTHFSRNGGILTGESRVFPPDGRPRILMITARLLYDRQNRVAGAIESLRDISGIRSAEEALRASEEKYRLVVEHSQDAIYIHRDNRLLFVNRRAQEITGYPYDELMAIRLWDLLHPDDRNLLIKQANERMAGRNVPSGFIARLITKDGRERPCEFFVDIVVYLGAPAILGIARDITVRE
ncbi:PAS domain S-box protein [Methanoregula sp.]|uniref:response regulator n=1 Tax=Methanoregula sp. TaxID=2052170 RepID=UPI002369DC06|nr:PAS domain S-box protein [Methanoregula sp.]MDD1687002.1 PAS domain S-box protein [Methanoregula sp.]